MAELEQRIERKAAQSLFQTLRQLASEGCSILYISHTLDEIRELCHYCTGMRGGRVTGACDPRRETDASLSLMIGGEPPAAPAGSHPPCSSSRNRSTASLKNRAFARFMPCAALGTTTCRACGRIFISTSMRLP